MILLTGALTIVFGPQEPSDFWVDALKLWWLSVKAQFPLVEELVIYLDNGPQNSGVRTQFLKRMVEFADWSGLRIRLVYYPPYHSKYNPIERCWSSLQKKWNGVLLTCVAVVLAFAGRMRCKGQHPTVRSLDGEYPIGIRISNRDMQAINARLERSTTLGKYDITIRPIQPRVR